MTLTQTSHDQTRIEAHSSDVVAPFPLDHRERGAQQRTVEGSSSIDHWSHETQSTSVDGSSSLPAKVHADPNCLLLEEDPFPAAIVAPYPTADPRRGPFLRDPVLALLSDSLDDIEELRIATENRVRQLTRTEIDVDGEYRGFGLNITVKEVARAQAMADSIAKVEHDAVLDLQRQIRKSPLYPWIQRQRGVGEKQGARLLAALGDPYWNDLHDRPRTVSELWAFAGYAVHDGRADRRQKGTRSNWSPTAKMRAYLMAESCVKALGGHYRDIYLTGREQYADATHPHDCVRCGPSGKPALTGTPLSAGHQHARALRLVAKEILRDLWIEAKTIHEGPEQ